MALASPLGIATNCNAAADAYSRADPGPVSSLPMTVTLTPEQLDLVLSEEFLAAIDPDYHDHFLVKIREGTYGNYAAVDFGPGSKVVIAALQQFAAGPDSPAGKLIRQVELAQR